MLRPIEIMEVPFFQPYLSSRLIEKFRCKGRTFRRPATVFGAACTTLFVGVLLVNRFLLDNATCVVNCTTVRYLSYERLQKNEASKRMRHPTIKSFDVNYLGSNSPIEDRFVAGFSQELGLGLFSVIDGHKGFRCSHFIQNHLLQYVAAALQAQVNAGKKSDVEIAMNMNYTSSTDKTFLDWISDSHQSPSGIPDSVVEECLTTSFKSLEEYISKQALNDVELVMQGHSLAPDMKERVLRAIEGACVTLATVQAHSISVATTGDCRVVVGQQQADHTWEAHPLSVDQNAVNPQEVQRVQNAHPGEENTVIFNGRILGSLMPFRTFGDVDFKWERKYLEGIVPIWPNYRTPPYITAKPVVTHRKRQPGDRFMIVGSDGLWERVSNEEAVNVVAQTLEQESGHESTFSLRSLFGKMGAERECCRKNAATHLLWHVLGGTEEAVAKLLNVSPDYSRMVRDDITIIVVFFNQ